MKFFQKDSFIKIVLLVIVTIILIWAFQTRYERFNADNHTTKAVVVHRAHTADDTPLVVVYRWHKGNHWLLRYEIDRKDNNRFIAQYQEKLDGTVERLQADKETSGIWAKIQGEWHYYNEQLRKENRHEQYRDQASDRSYPFTLNRDQETVEITMEDGENFHFPVAEHEQLQALYPITEDQSLWLAVFAKELKIITK